MGIPAHEIALRHIGNLDAGVMERFLSGPAAQGIVSHAGQISQGLLRSFGAITEATDEGHRILWWSRHLDTVGSHADETTTIRIDQIPTPIDLFGAEKTCSAALGLCPTAIFRDRNLTWHVIRD